VRRLIDRPAVPAGKGGLGARFYVAQVGSAACKTAIPRSVVELNCAGPMCPERNRYWLPTLLIFTETEGYLRCSEMARGLQ
jgi:hypothetical protein